jgi:hypothetical protein
MKAVSSTAFGSGLFRDIFSTWEVRAIVSEAGYLARRLEVEAALAVARRPAASGARFFAATAAFFPHFFWASPA